MTVHQKDTSALQHEQNNMDFNNYFYSFENNVSTNPNEPAQEELERNVILLQPHEIVSQNQENYNTFQEIENCKYIFYYFHFCQNILYCSNYL